MSVKRILELLGEEGLDAEPEEIGDVLEEGDWKNTSKDTSYQTVIICITDKHVGEDPELELGLYSIIFCRSGSYYSDYEYHVSRLFKVEAYEETVTKYRKVQG